MTQAQRDALGRLIDSVRANWLLAIPLSAKWPRWEGDAWIIADEGLTAKQAREIIANLDDPDERKTAAEYIAKLTSTADAVTLLKWLDAEVNRALEVEPRKPDAPPAHLPTWQPHNGAVLYLPATCGWYNGGEDMGAIIAWLAQYRGRVGLGFEATGSTGNLGVRTVDWRRAYADHCKRLAVLARQCAAAGVPVKIDAINSNDFGKGWAAGWKDTPANRDAVLSIMRGLATDLLAVRDWCIVQPVSEDDAAMPGDFIRAACGVWPGAGWPKSRLCMSGGIAESHTGELKPLNPPALAATDNGPAIERHFGRGVWTAHTPDVARCTAYARHYLGRGVHASLYHRADKLHLLEHAKAYEQIVAGAGIAGGADETAKPDRPAATFRYVGGGQRDVSWSPAVSRSGWPTKSVDGSVCDGLLFGAKVGQEERKIEWIKRGSQSAHSKNAWAFANDRKYNQGWQAGDEVTLSLRDVNGQMRPGSVRGTVRLG